MEAAPEKEPVSAPVDKTVEMVAEPEKKRLSLADRLGFSYDFSHLNRADPFKMKEYGVTWRSELRASLVTFLTMVYIVPVNAAILANVIGDPQGKPELACLPGDGMGGCIFGGYDAGRIALGQNPVVGALVNYREDLIVATAAACGIGCVLMGLMSNFPFALAPGMGSNAFFAFSVVVKSGVPWRTALAAIWIAGYAFAFLSITGIRTYCVTLMPACIRLSLSVGIGLFLAFIGLKDMGLIISNSATFVALNEPLSENNPDYQKIWLGICVLAIMGTLIARNFPGAILIGILFGTFVCWIDGANAGYSSKPGMRPFAENGALENPLFKKPSHFCYPFQGVNANGGRIFPKTNFQVTVFANSFPTPNGPVYNATTGLYVGGFGQVDPSRSCTAPDGLSVPPPCTRPCKVLQDVDPFGTPCAYDTTSVTTGGCTQNSFIYFPLKFAQPARCPRTCGALSFKNMGTSGWASAFLIILYTDILDNTGTFFAVSKIAGFLDPVTLQLPAARANMAYMADAIATITGSSLGASTVVTYIESATGVRDGGRTGVVAILCGIWFLFCLPFSPWLSQVPDLSAGPALVCVGVFMMESVKGIDWNSMEDALPAFITIIFMPLTFNIGHGIVAGFGCYLVGQLLLAPFRIYEGISPMIRWRQMLSGDHTTGLTQQELTEIKEAHADEQSRIERAKAEDSVKGGLPK